MARPLSELPVVIAQGGPLNGQRWGIAGNLEVGRDQACHIMIPDRQVSRFHARLTARPEGVSVEDLGSKNGTFLNGQRITQPVIINDGDMIQIALIQDLYFLSSDATMPLSQQIPYSSEGFHHKDAKISLDAKSRRVWVNSSEINPPLSAPQFRLLQTLYEQEGKVISRGDLISAIWGSDKAQGVSEQALDALVRRLRERLMDMDSESELIITVRGHGIRLENN